MASLKKSYFYNADRNFLLIDTVFECGDIGAINGFIKFTTDVYCAKQNEIDCTVEYHSAFLKLNSYGQSLEITKWLLKANHDIQKHLEEALSN